MRIFIDGDAFPATDIVVGVARHHQVPVLFYHNTRFGGEINDYVEEHVTDDKKDAVDFAILNAVEKGDIVFTNDAALASMLMVKGASVMDACGRTFSDEYVNKVMMGRYVATHGNAKMRNGYNLGKNDRPKKKLDAELEKLITAS